MWIKWNDGGGCDLAPPPQRRRRRRPPRPHHVTFLSLDYRVYVVLKLALVDSQYSEYFYMQTFVMHSRSSFMYDGAS